MKVVRQMVQKYVDNERCIILWVQLGLAKRSVCSSLFQRAVVPANVDIDTQEIVQLAEDADPKGRRTLGVITKPDLVDKGAEEKVIAKPSDLLPTSSTGSGNRSSIWPRTPLWPGLYDGLQQKSKQLRGAAR